MDIVIQALLPAAGFVMLIKGADMFVDGASGIALKFGIPQLVIGLTIVAMGTSAPEAAVSISAARKKNADIAIGNIVGSNIFNILFVIGISTLITPVPFSANFIFDTIIAAASAVLLLLCCIKSRRLNRISGIIMLIGYIAYFITIL